MSQPYNLELEIQNIVLTDITVNDPLALKQEITLELNRLFQQEGIPNRLTQATHRPLVKGGPMETVQSPSMQQLGTNIAQAIYRGLGK
ncbi:MAG: hypothetical protein AAFQ95_21260 [Cyanobacteria bacterium J06621_3]